MKELATYLIRSIVTHPDDVIIDEENLSNGIITLQVRVHPEDMGEVIGKGGKIIKSVRSLLKAAALKQGIHVRLDLLDETAKPTIE